MTLHQLEIWITVAKNQSISKAADELHIKQPAASQQIKALEKKCRIKLYKFYPGRGIELTQTGKIMLIYAKKILLQVKILESKLKSIRKKRRN